MNAKTYSTFQRRLVCAALVIILLAFLPIRAFATGGNVSGAIEGTWTAAQGEVKAIVNNVVFPVIDMVLAVLFFVKIATCYMDYRKHGQFDFTAMGGIKLVCYILAGCFGGYLGILLAERKRTRRPA